MKPNQQAVRSSNLSQPETKDYLADMLVSCMSENGLPQNHCGFEDAFVVGRSLMNGDKVQKNITQAKYIFWQIYEEFKNETRDLPQYVGLAAFYLAQLSFRDAENVVDLKRAEDALQFASNQNCTDARVELACRLLTGNQVSRDPERSVKILKALYEGKNDLGAYILGRCYLRGLGTQADLGKGIECLYFAAKSIKPEIRGPALRILGEVYLMGDGIEPDVRAASRFLYKAERAGDDQATSIIEANRLRAVRTKQL